MAANSVVILPSNTHNNTTNNTPLVGEKFKGAGFYGMGDGFHSVQIELTNFTGIVSIQGTLASTPTEEDWVDITLNDQSGLRIDTTGLITTSGSTTYIQLSYSPETPVAYNRVYNFIGNFVWIRANVSLWTAGHINRIMLNF